jgi:hypothetical protein
MAQVQIKGTLKGGSWVEEIVGKETHGVKVTHVTERWTLNGDFKGHGEAFYLLAYAPDGTVTYSGYERLTGAVGDLAGTLFVTTTGSFEHGVARGVWVVNAPMCSGDFATITQGEGSYAAAGHAPAPFSLLLSH